MTEFDGKRILAELGSAGVEYVAVGAIALAAHGVVRATQDVDIIPSPGEANLDRLVGAIAALGGAPYGEPQTAVTLDLLDRDANMRFATEAGQLDVLLSEQYRQRYPELARRAETLSVAGVAVTVVSRDDLIMLKAGSGRNRDLLDIGDLLALEMD